MEELKDVRLELLARSLIPYPGRQGWSYLQAFDFSPARNLFPASLEWPASNRRTAAFRSCPERIDPCSEQTIPQNSGEKVMIYSAMQNIHLRLRMSKERVECVLVSTCTYRLHHGFASHEEHSNKSTCC